MPEILVDDILKAGELGFIRVEEVRKNLTKIAKWELWTPEEQPQAIEKQREAVERWEVRKITE